LLAICWAERATRVARLTKVTTAPCSVSAAGADSVVASSSPAGWSSTRVCTI
jgi:hypothetical protein